MASRSAGVICVRMNFSAAARARNWSPGRHGGHVEVERQQPAILVSRVPGGSARDLRSAELVVDVDVFRLGPGGRGAGRRRQVLMFEETDRLAARRFR